MAGSRKTRRLDLTLLLAVAPLVAGCDGPEERHCVDAEGVYRPDEECLAPASASGTWDQAPPRRVHWVYVPQHHYGGIGTHAGSYVHSTSPGRGSAGVSRGGFGSTGAAHAAGHGGGHGAGG